LPPPRGSGVRRFPIIVTPLARRACGASVSHQGNISPSACEWRRDLHLQILVGAPASGCPLPRHAQHPHTARPRGTRRLRQQIKHQSHRAHSCPKEPRRLRDAGSSPNLRSGDGSSCLTEEVWGQRESPPQLITLALAFSPAIFSPAGALSRCSRYGHFLMPILRHTRLIAVMQIPRRSDATCNGNSKHSSRVSCVTTTGARSASPFFFLAFRRGKTLKSSPLTELPCFKESSQPVDASCSL